MTVADIDQVPMQCHGQSDAVSERIRTLGSTAILVFDGEQHVAQLQFRRYNAALRSPDGIWDPLYWGDFGETAPDLPPNSLSVFCYHVGQVDNTEARDPNYQGRGIGLAMLDFFLDWADAAGFETIAAKFTPSPRPVMGFMGGQPAEAYEARGFKVVNSWVDQQLYDVLREKELVARDTAADDVARVGCCVKTI